MDMSKYIKEKNLWIFDETFDTEIEKEDYPLCAFVDAKAYKTNGGKDTDVFIFAINGSNYMIMPFKVDYLDFVEKYGTDTKKWIGHQFKLIKNAKKKYVMVGIEEDI